MENVEEIVETVADAAPKLDVKKILVGTALTVAGAVAWSLFKATRETRHVNETTVTVVESETDQK